MSSYLLYTQDLAQYATQRRHSLDMYGVFNGPQIVATYHLMNHMTYYGHFYSDFKVHKKAFLRPDGICLGMKLMILAEISY